MVRSRLLPYLQSYLLTSMYGGYLNRGVDFAIVHLRALSNIAKKRGFSFGPIFVDVSAAFESVSRFLTIGDEPSDEMIVGAFLKLGFEAAIFEEFCQVARQPSAMSEAGVPDSLAQFVSSLHANAWGSVVRHQWLAQIKASYRKQTSRAPKKSKVAH